MNADLSTLMDLNRDYVDSVQKGDVRRTAAGWRSRRTSRASSPRLSVRPCISSGTLTGFAACG